MFPESTVWLVHKADNLAAICVPIVYRITKLLLLLTYPVFSYLYVDI
jgi:hypothetical protein